MEDKLRASQVGQVDTVMVVGWFTLVKEGGRTGVWYNIVPGAVFDFSQVDEGEVRKSFSRVLCIVET